MTPTNTQDVLTFFHRANELKTTRRYRASLKTEGDSVAEHSWRLALMAYTIATEWGVPIDVAKAVGIALVHDLAEARTGDIDAYEVLSGQRTNARKHESEGRAMDDIMSGVSFGPHIKALWEAYEDDASVEAKFVHALDGLEAFMHIAEVGVKDYLPAEFHGDYIDASIKAFDHAGKHFPILQGLLDQVKADLRRQFEAIGVAWVEDGK